MRSVFLRRMLIILGVAISLAVIFMSAGYLFLSKDAYCAIKLQEMLPKAEAVEQLMREYAAGEMSGDAFGRMSSRLMVAANATTCITDATGNILFLNDADLALSPELLGEDFQRIIAPVLEGERLQRSGVSFAGKTGMLLAGIPIQDVNGTVQGSVIIIKSEQEITAAMSRMNSSLLMSVAIVVPLVLLFFTLSAKRIAAPLNRMTDVAIEMSKGNFFVRADDMQSGEVGVLARALNTLCENLSQTIFQLRSEKSQLNQLLYSLTDGVAATDGLGMLTHFNPALMRMFGAVQVGKREELVADSTIWQAFDEVYTTRQSTTLTYHQDNNDRTLWITISPVMTEDGDCTGVVGLFKDMTEIERLEATRREYVANVSHELRTPLTAIRGLLEPLADGMVTVDEDRQRYYKTMLHEVMRLSRLITDMMTLSRLQAGTEYMELTRVDVDELVNDLVQGYKATAAKRGIELKVDAPDMPDAFTDPDRVEQVLVILIDNAMRYTPQGGSITLRVKNADRLMVSVADTGCGIPEADREHVFERFYKVDKSRKEGGTGLGLSIARYIMEKLGETINVESTVGVGTTFTFTLKKYSRNVIALGPGPDDRAPCAAQTGDGDRQGGAQQDLRRKNPYVDAPYELVNTPPKQKRWDVRDINIGREGKDNKDNKESKPGKEGRPSKESKPGRESKANKETKK